jgi:hypothetical protein
MQRGLNFMCSKHRQFCIDKPKKAQLLWAKSLLSGRGQVCDGHYKDSVRSYGNALEIASILLVNDSDSARAEVRYSQTLTEFAYILRASEQPFDAQALLELARGQFQQSHRKSVEVLIEDLIQALICSQQHVVEWLERLKSECSTLLQQDNTPDIKTSYIH